MQVVHWARPCSAGRVHSPWCGDVCKTVSGEELTFVGNTAVRDTDDATTGVTSGKTTFTSSRQANGVLRRSRGRLREPCFQQDHTTRSGDVRGATSYSLACTAAGSCSYTSEGCGLVGPPQTHYSVSDGLVLRELLRRRKSDELPLYNSSALQFVMDHDLLTRFDPGGVQDRKDPTHGNHVTR